MPRGGIVSRMQLRQFGFHRVVTQAERRTAAAVDPVKFVFFRAVNDREQIAADSVRDRLHQSERGVRRDRGVHCAAAAFQNFDPDLRRGRHAGANHSVRASTSERVAKFLPVMRSICAFVDKIEPAVSSANISG